MHVAVVEDDVELLDTVVVVDEVAVAVELVAAVVDEVAVTVVFVSVAVDCVVGSVVGANVGPPVVSMAHAPETL